MIEYRKATFKDVNNIAKLLAILYEYHSVDELIEEVKSQAGGKSNEFFLASDGDLFIGIAHCALRREYVEGADGGTTGYFEAVYVLPEYRKKGIARRLAELCEQWAKRKGCSNFASDCALDNETSYKFHLAIGFKEVSRNIHFIKNIQNDLNQNPLVDLTDDEKIDAAAKRVLERYRSAFKELAK